ncbi:MAG: hypothetical protein FRX49_11045 [Trebouxia sp. A1-2]|nr:MAG: hypothetical protein FRX49_11045 [Trebouxia sp. A1-2]
MANQKRSSLKLWEQATLFLVCRSIFDISESSDLLIPEQDQQLSPDRASDSSQDPFGPDPLSFSPASPLSVQTLGSASSEALEICKFLEDLAAHGWESGIRVEVHGPRRGSVGAGWSVGDGVRGRRGPEKGNAEVGGAEIDVAGVELKLSDKEGGGVDELWVSQMLEAGLM